MINLVYIALSFVFAAVITYMVVYNTHLKTKQAALHLKGRLPFSKEEGIALALEERGHPVR